MNRVIHIGAGLALLTAATIVPAQRPQVPASCGVLTVAELEAAIGGKASKPSGSKQALPVMTMDVCTFMLSDGGKRHPVSIKLISNLGKDGAEVIKNRNAGTGQQTKGAGARFEQSTVGPALCILAGRPSVASHTICSIPRGQGYLEVDVGGDVADLPSMATVGALAQKAAGRL